MLTRMCLANRLVMTVLSRANQCESQSKQSQSFNISTRGLSNLKHFYPPVLTQCRFLSQQNSDTQPSPSLLITERCMKRIEQVLEPDELIRVGVRGGGCSGFEYEVSIEKRTDMNAKDDILFEQRVVVDSESINYVNGAKLDYEDELIRSGFRVIDNPLAEKGCSCGSSFSLKF